MNKNELIRWLKSEKESALIAHRNTFESNQTKAKERLYEACGANYLISKLNELAKEEEKLIKAFNDCNAGKIRMEPYYLHSDAEAYLKISDTAYTSLRGIYREQQGKIEKNYNNVIQQVRLLPLKNAVDWLTELGFEIPESATNVKKNEIVVMVDTSYLRLKSATEVNQ